MQIQTNRTDRHHPLACWNVSALVHDLVPCLNLTTVELYLKDTTNFLPLVAQSWDPLGFFASVVLLATGFSWRVLSAIIPSSFSSSNNGSEVNRFSNVVVGPAFTSHFSMKLKTTSAPWPRPVSRKSVLAPQYGSAWRRYPSNEVMHQSLNPNLIGFPLINCFVPCFPL